MGEHENSLTPEEIDRQTERWSSELPSDEQSLVQNLYASSQAYSQENERSLERIWNRFVEQQERLALSQRSQLEESGEDAFSMEGKAMQEHAIYVQRPVSKRYRQVGQPAGGSYQRLLSIGVAVAIILITVVSYVVFSSNVHYGQHPVTIKPPITQVGSGKVTPTPHAIHSASAVCRISNDSANALAVFSPTLGWSSTGQIVTTLHDLKTFSAQDCIQKLSLSPVFMQATWSPNGKSLLVHSGGGAHVLNGSTGSVIATFKNPVSYVNQSVWTSNGTQIVTTGTQLTSDASYAVVEVWDASTGNLVRTALTFSPDKKLLGSDGSAFSLSPDGKFVAVLDAQNKMEIWSVVSGNQVGSIPFGQSDLSTLVWSPNDASLAVGLSDAPTVQIWSVASGHMTGFFHDSDTWATLVSALAWSPDGKYVAESTSDIHIWDVSTQKIVATFNKIDNTHKVSALAWSPDSSMLVSATSGDMPVVNGQGNATQCILNVWKLS
jgi:uncharacterized protein with WD repeat